MTPSLSYGPSSGRTHVQINARGSPTLPWTHRDSRSAPDPAAAPSPTVVSNRLARTRVNPRKSAWMIMENRRVLLVSDLQYGFSDSRNTILGPHFYANPLNASLNFDGQVSVPFAS